MTTTTPQSSAPQPPHFLESFKTTSSAILLIGSFTLAFAVYMIQRGALAIVGDINVTNGDRQGDYNGLSFSYATVSLLGPPIMAFLCLVLATLAEARSRAWLAYLNSGGEPEIPPWTTGSGNDRHSSRLRLWFRMIAELPLIAFIVHICAGARVVQMGVSQWIKAHGDVQVQQAGYGEMVPEPVIWVPVGLAMIVVCIVTLRAVRELRQTVAKLNLIKPLASTEVSDKSG